MNTIKKINVTVNGLNFTIRTAGLENAGDLIIFLHGFPESSLMWEQTMIKFAKLGYKTLAPDQRGYSKGAQPRNINDYAMPVLVDDIISMVKTLGITGKVHLVGHDIGAVVGWTAVTMYPEYFASWTALSVPYWPAYVWALKNDPVQKTKGAYVERFQHPDLSEQLLLKDDGAIFHKLWTGFKPSTIEQYSKIFSDRQSLTAIVNWYRALFQTKTDVNYRGVKTPTEFIWGNQDLAIGRAGVEKNADYMLGNYHFDELNAGHWLLEFNEPAVFKLIAEHIRLNS